MTELMLFKNTFDDCYVRLSSDEGGNFIVTWWCEAPEISTAYPVEVTFETFALARVKFDEMVSNEIESITGEV